MAQSDGTALGDRMKGYETVWRNVLPRRLAYVVRVDGKAFHSYLRTADRPFDLGFVEQMGQVAAALCNEIQGAVFAYHQSDEISVLVRDGRDAEPWFGGRVQKIVSVSAGLASAVLGSLRPGRPVFDARVFVLPDPPEVGNYFVWRQRDAIRNAITMAAHAQFGHALLDRIDSTRRLEMLAEAGVDFEAYPEACRRGQVALRCTQEGETTFVDRRTGAEESTTVIRSSWQVEPAPEFGFEPGGFLAETIPLIPQLRPETAAA